ncbi:MFS transporter [Pseudomonas sp. R5(2019)]|uniref:MFS transporter n=1 Tax=Pseudomonas sp. R5(2019) TaxID=2697566 RepID=UPI001412382D|nr:MFS transporter [Pseudomonas sp. R5(2019)]NBA96576.1 MFS transporter [Pseudomonas sp. R5(2019)]
MQSIKQPPDSAKADTRHWLGLSLLMLPVLLITIDNTILGFALPKIAEALAPSASQQLWMIDAYSLVLAALLVTMGGIGDRVGHRFMLLMGALGFAVFSVLTAMATTPEQLIGGRALMGVFGAMLMPSTLALLGTLFQDREQRRVAVAVWATCLTVGSALGPLIGGVLLQFFNWPSIFWLAVPVLVPLLLFGPVLLPESDRALSGRIDLYSIVLSMLALTGIVFAIKHVAAVGVDSISAIGLLIGMVAGAVFVRRQLRLEVPLLDLALLRNGTFSGAVLVNLLSLALLVGFVFFATQQLQIVLGLAPLTASLALVPGQVLAIVVGMAIVPIAQRVSAHRLIPVLLGFAGAAFLLVALAGGGIATLVIAFALLNIGVGAIASVSTDLVLSAAPPSKAGAASAISETAYEVGVVFGTTVLGGVLAAVYRNVLELPAELTGEQAWLASETLAGAGVVATSLGELGTALTAAAHTAFGVAINQVSWLAVALSVIAIGLAWRTFKAGRS